MNTGPVQPIPTDDDSRPPEPTSALCLSGGGYRAMVFHIGVLWRLYETGLLQNIKRISSVRADRLTAGQLALAWRKPSASDPTASGAISFPNSSSRCAPSPASRSTRNPSSWARCCRAASATASPRRMTSTCCHGKTLQDMPDEPRFVIDADLADYFGSIPHTELLKSVARRIVDRRVLRLIKMWLECPVEETDDRGRKTRTTEARDNRRGIPQGSPISPLLANTYMRRFVLGWKKLRLEQRLGSRIVTYADDLVILCKKGKAEEALQQLREIMSRLKLTVNEEKTQICRVPEGEFDFLGYTFGRMFSERTGQARLGYRPSKKSIKRMVEKIHALTDRTGTWQETTKLVGKVNRTLRGWANYFQVGTVSKAYRALDSYAAMRLRRWLQFKHKTRRRKGGTYPLPHLYGHFGLVRLSRLGHDVPWVKA